MLLAHDVWKALWFDRHGLSASASARWCCSSTSILLGGYTFGCHSLRHLVGGMLDELSQAAGAQDSLRLRELPEPPPHAVGLVQPVLGRLHRSYVRLCSMGIWTDWRIF